MLGKKRIELLEAETCELRKKIADLEAKQAEMKNTIEDFRQELGEALGKPLNRQSSKYNDLMPKHQFLFPEE